MKKTLFLFIVSILINSVQAQPHLHSEWQFPKSQKEDKDRIMSKEYWNIWSPQVQKQIDQDIEKYRKADAVLNLPNAKEGTKVKIKQMSHDFVFGAHIFNFNQLGDKELNERYRNLYGTLFNSATVPFYWKKHEMQPNRPRYKEEYWDTEDFWNNVDDPVNEPHWRRPASDPLVEFCESKNIRIHGHPIIWGNMFHHPQWIFDEFVPEEEKKIVNDWIRIPADEKKKRHDQFTDEFRALAPREIEKKIPIYTQKLNELFEKRVIELAEYYGSRIHSWDVVNESATDYALGNLIEGDLICKSRYGLLPGDYAYKAFETATKFFPADVKLNINDFKIDQYYTNQTKELLSKGCKVDIMGAQLHLFNPQQCRDIAAGKEIAASKQVWPKQVWDAMQEISKVGIPIHLSEVTVTSPDDNHQGLMIQAIITQNLYRLWFSIESMMGITWWNVVDGCGAYGEPSNSGIFTRDMQPKPAYFALQNLINNEWKTNETIAVKKDGVVKFRGFKGKYQVEWIDEHGQVRESEFYLKNDGDGL